MRVFSSIEIQRLRVKLSHVLFVSCFLFFIHIVSNSYIFLLLKFYILTYVIMSLNLIRTVEKV